MKKSFAIFLSTILTAGMLVGCSSKGTPSKDEGTKNTPAKETTISKVGLGHITSIGKSNDFRKDAQLLVSKVGHYAAKNCTDWTGYCSMICIKDKKDLKLLTRDKDEMAYLYQFSAYTPGEYTLQRNNIKGNLKT